MLSIFSLTQEKRGWLWSKRHWEQLDLSDTRQKWPPIRFFNAVFEALGFFKPQNF